MKERVVKHSIIPQLIKKDFLMTRKSILIFSWMILTSIGVLGFLYGRIPNWAFANIAFVLLAAPAATCGMILLMKTNVFEKEKSTQPFIMSLPVTVKEFTLAKLMVNLPVFASMWIVVTGVAFYFSFSAGLFPAGILPFLTMIFLGVFTAYICVLGVSLMFQSLGITVLAIMIFELGTSAYLWIVVYLEPIRNHIYGPAAVWNSTALTVVAMQALVAISMLAITLIVQNGKRDFV